MLGPGAPMDVKWTRFSVFGEVHRVERVVGIVTQIECVAEDDDSTERARDELKALRRSVVVEFSTLATLVAHAPARAAVALSRCVELAVDVAESAEALDDRYATPGSVPRPRRRGKRLALPVSHPGDGRRRDLRV
jgi:hypothetical protein